MNPSAPTGLLLFAHGARDPNWALPFQAVARLCRTQRGEDDGSDSTVCLAFLEFMQPDLLAAGHQLVAQGCRSVVVVPLFLGAGGHVRKDLPALMAQLRTAHPDVAFNLQPAVGEADAVVTAMAQVALEGAAQAAQNAMACASPPKVEGPTAASTAPSTAP